MTCHNCNFQNPASNAFCGQCGHALPLAEGEIPNYKSRSVSVKRESAIILVGIALILGALAGVYILFLVPRSPAFAVRKFIEADLSGNFAQQSQYVSNRWDSHLFLSTFQTLRQAAGASPFKNYRFLDTAERGGNATVSVQITVSAPVAANPALVAPAAPAAPTALIIPFVLIHEDNEWRIDSASTSAGLAGVLMAFGINQVPANTLVPFLGAPGGPIPPPTTTPFPQSPGNNNGGGLF
jgi:hypothetical protein